MTIKLTPPQIALAMRVREQLDRGSADFPVLSERANELVDIASARELDFASVIRIAESDPPLTARILGVASSPLYRSRSEITSVDRAIAQLGAQVLRDVLYQYAFGSTLLDDGAHQEVLRGILDHSVTVGRIARRIDDLAGLRWPRAFLGGLLHDVGKARVIRWASKDQSRPTSADLLAVADDLHALAGPPVLEAWNLPEDIVSVCAHHHDPKGDDRARAVGLADRLAYLLDAGTSSREEAAQVWRETMRDMGAPPRAIETAIDDIVGDLECAA